jgi:hypothetical protein
MSNSYTPNTQLAMPAVGDRGWNTALNGNFTILDGLAPVAALAVTTTEIPSASLNVRVAPGTYLRQDGTIAPFVGAASYTLPASATVALYLDLTQAGALTASTTGFPTTAHVRLATIVTAAATISSISDARVALQVLGSFADGVNLSLGSTIGTQIGTASTQKLAFFGKTPITQPIMGAATAGASYTSNEQTMLQAVYNAVRNLGLGS